MRNGGTYIPGAYEVLRLTSPRYAAVSCRVVIVCCLLQAPATSVQIASVQCVQTRVLVFIICFMVPVDPSGQAGGRPLFLVEPGAYFQTSIAKSLLVVFSCPKGPARWQ